MPKIPSQSNGQDASFPLPGRKKEKPENHSRHIRRLPDGCTGIVFDVAGFLAQYIVVPPTEILVLTTWVMAAWLVDLWDRFPHLAITSPDRRCGKTRLLDLLKLITPEAHCTTNISPAVVYRLVEARRPTLLLDEAQSIHRRASEISEVLRELLNAGMDKDATVIRCGGKQMTEIERFRIYSPKVIALIGELDGVLADRCLPINMKRKTTDDIVAPYRSRIVRPIGEKLHEELDEWSETNSKRVGRSTTL